MAIADLPIQNIRHNVFKLSPDSGIHGVTIRDRVIHNTWQRSVKSVCVPAGDSRIRPPKNCRIEYCPFLSEPGTSPGKIVILVPRRRWTV